MTTSLVNDAVVVAVELATQHGVEPARYGTPFGRPALLAEVRTSTGKSGPVYIYRAVR